MNAIARGLDELAGRVERARRLDPLAERFAGAIGRLVPTGPVKDAASGTSLGHPLHPALTAVPIGCWLAAGYIDLCVEADGRSRALAQRLVGLGVLAAIPTAIAGTSDWLDTAGAERRIGVTHGLAAVTALVGYGGSWFLRRSHRHRAGVVMATASGTIVALTGWLGAHLVFAAGVGVDTTAFQRFPTEWTDVGAESAINLESVTCVDANGVPLLLSRTGREIRVIADRCTHRGAPLHEGEVVDGCVTCPWHGSRFDLVDGSVVRGPASRPQPHLEARVVDGRVEVRRSSEVRALRLNPVGV